MTLSLSSEQWFWKQPTHLKPGSVSLSGAEIVEAGGAVQKQEVLKAVCRVEECGNSTHSVGGYEAHLLRTVNGLLCTLEGDSCISSVAFLELFIYVRLTSVSIVLSHKTSQKQCNL